jgi:glycosyltransferase involved in cell wall biosynthesis
MHAGMPYWIVELMKTTCLVSCYNYARFVGEAVDSALRQTIPFDQIVVVDDGSTDGSLELLTGRYGRDPVVQLVGKTNQGQLSCFNEGFARATGDVVFFLDADDVYEPDYVEEMLQVYQQDPSCDFLYCGRVLFGQRNETIMAFSEDRNLGYSLIETAYARTWIGAATSCVSMRRSLLQKILPLPFIDDWRVRADDCLVFGASLAGGRKRFLAQPLVRYRVHGSNHHRDRTKSHLEIYRRRLAINRLFEHFERVLCINTARLAEIGHREFLTVEMPSIGQLMKYTRISMGARLPIVRRIGYAAEMMWHYFRSRQYNPAAAAKRLSPTTKRAEAIPLESASRRSTTGGRDAVPVSAQDSRVA